MDSRTAGAAVLPPSEALPDWLRQLSGEGRPRVLLGATGHLDLTEEEEARTARLLEDVALPALGTATADAEIVIVTGLAPGGRPGLRRGGLGLADAARPVLSARRPAAGAARSALG